MVQFNSPFRVWRVKVEGTETDLEVPSQPELDSISEKFHDNDEVAHPGINTFPSRWKICECV